MCAACSVAEAAARAADVAAAALALPERSAFYAEEFGPALFYYGRRAASQQSAGPGNVARQARAAAASAEAARLPSSPVEPAAASRGPKPSQTGEHITLLERDAAVYRGKLVPEGHVGFGILSFNLLAQCYVRVDGQPWNAFAHCQDEYLSWERRVPRILRILQDSLADVICLQEVVLERRAPPGGGAEEWGLPAWTKQLEGYTGVLQGLKQKDWENAAERNQKVVGVKAPTGLATFYRSAELEECQAPKSGSGSGLAVFLRRRPDGATSGPALEVTVGNIHLVGNPEKSEEHVTALSSCLKNFGKREHRVICGDFNGELEPGSSVAEWAAEEGLRHAPTGTSWAEPEKAMRLDHVLHSFGLHLQAASGPLLTEEVASGLPCVTCPSDHAPVAVLLSGLVSARCPW